MTIHLPRYITERELEALGLVKAQTLRIWRAQGKGPPYVRAGGGIRYDQAAVARWIETHTTRPEPEPKPASPAKPVGEILSDLERLAKLKAAGILSDDEVAILKAWLLAR